jgi:hypothetical protein
LPILESFSHKTLDAVFARMIVSDQGAPAIHAGPRPRALIHSLLTRCLIPGVEGYETWKSIEK